MSPSLPLRLIRRSTRALRMRLALWFEPPARAILSAAFLGLASAANAIYWTSSACFDATGSAVPAHLFLVFRVSPVLCETLTKTPPWVLLSGMVAAPSILLTWYWRDRKRRDDHRLAVEAGIAERYTRTTEMLGATDQMTRINGLFSLWDIARESTGHRETVFRTLAAFVRVRSQVSDEPNDDPLKSTDPQADVQAAVTLLIDAQWSEPEWQLEGAADLRNSNLRRVDFARGYLARAKFGGADLRRANLSGANLAYSNFDAALLDGAVLDGAELDGASLLNTALRKASLCGAAMTRAELAGSDLPGADLHGARLDWADLNNTTFDGATLNGATLDSASLVGASLVGANLIRASLRRANLQTAVLRDANLMYANLQGADLRSADLRGADLKGAELTGAVLDDPKLAGVDLGRPSSPGEAVVAVDPVDPVDPAADEPIPRC